MEIKKEILMAKYPAAGRLIYTMPIDLWESCRLVTMRPGEFFHKKGEELSRVLIICDGNISIYEDEASGKETQVVLLEAGGMVGEVEAVTRQIFMRYSAQATTSCTVVAMSVATFLQWMKTDISICLALIEVLAEKVWSVSDEVVLHIQSSAIELLCSRLLRAEVGCVKLSRQELAKRCGVDVRTVNRAVKKLSEEGYITLEHRKIYISKEQKILLAQSKYLNK